MCRVRIKYCSNIVRVNFVLCYFIFIIYFIFFFGPNRGPCKLTQNRPRLARHSHGLVLTWSRPTTRPSSSPRPFAHVLSYATRLPPADVTPSSLAAGHLSSTAVSFFPAARQPAFLLFPMHACSHRHRLVMTLPIVLAFGDALKGSSSIGDGGVEVLKQNLWDFH